MPPPPLKTTLFNIMELSLKVSSGSFSEEELHSVTRQLAQAIQSETGIAALIPEYQPTPGVKGTSSILGEIALTLLSSGGAAVALIGVLKAYFDRASNFSINIKRPDGPEITISAQNMKPEQIENTVARINDLFQD
jgi:hypothetical protein